MTGRDDVRRSLASSPAAGIALRRRGFRGCVGVGELEVDRVGLCLDLGREGRRARIAVAGGDEALGGRFGFCDELRGDVVRIVLFPTLSGSLPVALAT